MRRRIAFPTLVLLSLAAACAGDARTSTEPLTLSAPPASIRAAAPGTCTSGASLQKLVQAALGRNVRLFNTARGGVDNLIQLVNRRQLAEAQAKALQLGDAVLAAYRDHQTTGSEGDVLALVNAVFCYAGLPMSAQDADNAFVVYPSDTTQTVVASDDLAGIKFEEGSVTEPTLVTIYKIDPTPFTQPGSGPLETKLDQYPGFYDFVKQSATNAPLAQPVIVAVCVTTTGLDPAVANRLRLGHQKSAGPSNFEITPPVDPSKLDFLSCPDPTLVASRLPGWMDDLAQLVLPRAAFASAAFLSGGVGGTAGELSPFAPVDILLSASGGVGGTAGELRPLSPIEQVNGRWRAPVSNAAGAELTCTDEVHVGDEVPAGCRPAITVQTRLGTLLANVPVSFVVQRGGGTVAPDIAVPDCGTFASTAVTPTGHDGTARACWRVGSAQDTNVVTANPSAGGDAPFGVNFFMTGGTFRVVARAPSQVEITPATASTSVGSTQAFSAVVKDATGFPLNNAQVTWSISDPLVASLSPSTGTTTTATGIAPGTVTITATLGSLSGTATLTVMSLCSFDGLFTFGAASATTGAGCGLRLVPALGGQVGGAWSRTKIKVVNGFTTEFTFRLSPGATTGVGACDGMGCGADGLAFLIQDEDGELLGNAGGGIGYDGIPRSLAVEFDSWYNGDVGDPNSNHMGIQSCGAQANTVAHNGPCDLGHAVLPGELIDSQVHAVKIVYTPGSNTAGPMLQVYLDGTLVKTASVNLGTLGVLDAQGMAWVGFTAATGAAWSNHDVLSWSFSGAP
ncbi:MAG TPA: Ig-like domain-containing protein [Gemmatimonadaceae bacterium]